jgi:hypothetical protein
MYDLIMNDKFIMFNYKCNPCKHGFHKINSTTTKLIKYLNFITPFNTQEQTFSLYFDFNRQGKGR